ncbi:MAG: chromosomal replication initiator protein DnaA [Planctomycetota bacterium]
MVVGVLETVQSVETRIADKLGPQRFNTWFKNSTRLEFVGGCMRIIAPNLFVSEWIERNFSTTICEAAKDVTGQDFSLVFALDPKLAKQLGRKQPDRQAEFAANNPERLARQQRRLGPAQPAYPLRGRLDDFVVGASNQLAFTASCEVAQNPAKTLNNPLFIHGGCGLGKTHLLQGICNRIRETHPQTTWRYVSGEEFTNDYICSVKSHEESAFRERYRNLDVLVIDDVHFFANKRATQEEFLHTLKAIETAGKQIVLASDAPPKMIGHFSEMLISRFLSGRVVRIESPDLEVRANVLRDQAKRLGVEVSDAVIQKIAERLCSNIRELNGALLNVVAQAQLTKQPITLSLAERAIRDIVRQNAPVVMLSDIESIVTIFFGLTPPDLHTSRKSRPVALARGIVMYLARKHTEMSYPEIGRFMGKNHSTVILAERRIRQMLQQNANATWLTPAGPKERNVAVLMTEMEEQLGLGRKTEVA